VVNNNINNRRQTLYKAIDSYNEQVEATQTAFKKLRGKKTPEELDGVSVPSPLPSRISKLRKDPALL
jgi:hypothetical protein